MQFSIHNVTTILNIKSFNQSIDLFKNHFEIFDLDQESSNLLLYKRSVFLIQYRIKEINNEIIIIRVRTVLGRNVMGRI